MKRYNEELVHEETRDGYSVKLYLSPEEDAPDWDFESDADRDEVLRKIDAGIYLWFVAHVVAERDGFTGEDYLGGCCYDSVADFIEPGDYFDDMVHRAIAECATARATEAQRRAFC